MGLGISGDMFSAACYSFMDGDQRGDYLERAGKGCEELGCRLTIEEMSCPPLSGHRMRVASGDASPTISAIEASRSIGMITEKARVSEAGRAFATKIFQSIVEAEMSVHGIGVDRIHLHEIGRTSGLFNIASAGLCYDVLSLGGREVIGSQICLGGGRVETEHGLLQVPAPASMYLSKGLMIEPGPYDGEMATPTGIAIARNLISGQAETLPEPGRCGIGFGSKSFKGVLGSLRLFESLHPATEGD